MHNPPGSNNRLNEQSAQNSNPSRLFTSNNNRRGGYNVPDSGAKKAEDGRGQFMMKYFAGSHLRIEWAQLHGCDDGDRQRCRVTIEVLNLVFIVSEYKSRQCAVSTFKMASRVKQVFMAVMSSSQQTIIDVR